VHDPAITMICYLATAVLEMTICDNDK